MLTSIFSAAALLSLASAHGVILAAQGEAGPASVGFAVNANLPRNCTLINPCQQDTTIIRQSEIDANVVNGCGRTEIGGNIDIGTETENALAAKQVTQVTAGSKIQVTLHQVNDDGAGPYVCDIDSSSNAGNISGAGVLVTNNVPGANGLSQVSTTEFNMTVTLPQDLTCTGGSTGNVCTVRCRNNALAGPFGGCFAVQQTDITPQTNSAATIKNAVSLKTVQNQVTGGAKDLPVAIAGNQATGDATNVANLAAANEILQPSVVSIAAPTQTPDAAKGIVPAADPAATAASSSSAAAAASPAAAKGNGNNNKGNGNANANGNAAKAGAAAKAGGAAKGAAAAAKKGN